MLELGCLDETGLLCDTASGVQSHQRQSAWKIPDTDLLITQQDIRQIQLAKAAVFAGIQTLLTARGITADAVDHFYICGGFGHYMNLDSAVKIGLFPAELRHKATVLGNAALAGAAYVLLDQSAPKKLDAIKNNATEYPLSGSAVFSENYIDSMMFEL